MRSLEYLRTPTEEWPRRIAPSTDETLRLIVGEPRIYHAHRRCPEERSSANYGYVGQ